MIDETFFSALAKYFLSTWETKKKINLNRGDEVQNTRKIEIAKE
jgi:hypothetical protein